MKTTLARCVESFGIHMDFARGIMVLYIFRQAVNLYLWRGKQGMFGTYKESRIIERKRFQIFDSVSHRKCCSLGVSWGKWYIEFHILWYMIGLGDTGFHSYEFYEKNELNKPRSVKYSEK